MNTGYSSLKERIVSTIDALTIFEANLRQLKGKELEEQEKLLDQYENQIGALLQVASANVENVGRVARWA